MTVTIAKSAGFCFGVKRAVNLVYEEAEKSSPVYTMGPIIHNDNVVQDLEAKGVRIIDDDLICTADGCRPPAGATVVIRSHGISKAQYECLQASGYRLTDATCPFVQKIHTIVSIMSQKGYPVVIIGDPNHPEVIGIRGWVKGKCRVISNSEEARQLSFDRTEAVCVVSQTTYNYDKFQELVEIIETLGYHVMVTNTICSATRERQTEAMELASASDVMLVIGGVHSSNTQKLYNICQSRCGRTYFVSSLQDLETIRFEEGDRIGITAGASTPNTLIQEVSQHVRRAELRTDAQRKFQNY